MAVMNDDLGIGRLIEATRRLAAYTAGRARDGRSHDDADDVAGTVDTDDAHGFDPLPLLRALDRSGARVVVIGQVAGIMHGSAELTGDLDLLWSGAADQAPLLASAFTRAGAFLAGGDGTPVACDAAAFGLPKVVFRTEHASGDCCTPALPWGGIPVLGMLARARTAVAADGTAVRYLDLPDLIRMRRAVGRAKDLRRAEELARLVPG
jgi:hypothetical protein